MALPNIPESISLDQQDAEQQLAPKAPPYQLRHKRAPRYRCGNCGSRNCSCVNLVEVRIPGKRLARGADVPFQDLVDVNALDHPQQDILSIHVKYQDVPLVHSIVITVANMYSNIGQGMGPPLETTLKAMHETSPTGCINYRFKERTWH